MTTMQVHGNNFCNPNHNLREGSYAVAPHIDPSKTPDNETWRHQTIKDAYHDIFDASVASYNANKRKDRQITDYYRKVEDDKEKNVAYEFVVGVYHPVNKKGEPYDLGGFTEAQAKAAMKEYFETFEQRNPSMRCFGAYYHQDEKGQPHMHLDFIPTACTLKEITKGKQKGKLRGMELENTLSGALKELGFETKPGTVGTAQTQWEKREAAVFEKICQKHGIKHIRHPRKEKDKCLGLDITDYKRTMEKVNETEINYEKSEQARQAAADERAAAEKTRQEAERIAAEQAVQLRRLREKHEKELAEEKKAADKKIEEERKAAENKLQEDLAANLHEQRLKQVDILAAEIQTARTALNNKLEEERAANKEKIEKEYGEQQKAADEKLADTKLACADAEQHLKDLEEEIDNRTGDVKGFLNFSDSFKKGAKKILGFTIWKNKDAETMFHNYKHLWSTHTETRKLAEKTQERINHLDELEGALEKAKNDLNTEKENRTTDQKAHDKEIRALKEKLDKKTKECEALEEKYAGIRRCVYKVLNYFGVGKYWDTNEKMRVGYMAEDYAKREELLKEYKPLGFEKLEFVTLTIQEDEAGTYGLLENKRGDKRMLSSTQVKSLTEGMENVYHGNSAGFASIEVSSDKTISRKLYSPSQYFKRDKQITLSRSLKQKLQQQENEREW